MHSLQTQVKELRERVNSPNDTVETMRLVKLFYDCMVETVKLLEGTYNFHIIFAIAHGYIEVNKITGCGPYS